MKSMTAMEKMHCTCRGVNFSAVWQNFISYPPAMMQTKYFESFSPFTLIMLSMNTNFAALNTQQIWKYCFVNCLEQCVVITNTCDSWWSQGQDSDPQSFGDPKKGVNGSPLVSLPLTLCKSMNLHSVRFWGGRRQCCGSPRVFHRFDIYNRVFSGTF